MGSINLNDKNGDKGTVVKIRKKEVVSNTSTCNNKIVAIIMNDKYNDSN